MPSPVGHTILGLGIYVVWCKNIRAWLSQWPLILWVIFCSNLPDFDLFVGLSKGDLSRFHQTYTHTIGFALLVWLATFLVLKSIRLKNENSISFLTFLLVFFHILLDVFNYDRRPPIGVMLFWPFSNKYFNFIPIFYPVPHTRVSDIFSSPYVNAAVREVAVLIIPFFILIYFKLKKGHGKG